MNPIQYVVALFSLICLVGVTFFVSIQRKVRKKKYIGILFMGGMGWLIAFLLRLIPLDLMRVLTLFLLGVNLNDTAAIQEASTNFFVLMWGPLFAGLFEEFFRYFLILKLRNVKENYPRGPLILGLGWGFGEILYLYLSQAIKMSIYNIPWTAIQWELVLAGIFERVIATFFHILMSLIIFQAILEKEWSKKRGVELAITLHILFDGLIILWIKVVSAEYMLFIWTLESAFAIFALLTLIFFLKYWNPKTRSKLKNLTDEEYYRIMY